MTDNERIAHIDEKLDDLIKAFNRHAIESEGIRIHVGLLRKIVYGAIALGLTGLAVALLSLVVKQ